MSNPNRPAPKLQAAGVSTRGKKIEWEDSGGAGGLIPYLVEVVKTRQPLAIQPLDDGRWLVTSTRMRANKTFPDKASAMRFAEALL